MSCLGIVKILWVLASGVNLGVNLIGVAAFVGSGGRWLHGVSRSKNAVDCHPKNRCCTFARPSTRPYNGLLRVNGDITKWVPQKKTFVLSLSKDGRLFVIQQCFQVYHSASLLRYFLGHRHYRVSITKQNVSCLTENPQIVFLARSFAFSVVLQGAPGTCADAFPNREKPVRLAELRCRVVES